MEEEDARLQSKCVILIFLAVQGMPMGSVTVLWFAALVFGYDGLYPHSPLFKVYHLCFYITL